MLCGGSDDLGWVVFQHSDRGLPAQLLLTLNVELILFWVVEIGEILVAYSNVVLGVESRSVVDRARKNILSDGSRNRVVSLSFLSVDVGLLERNVFAVCFLVMDLD